MCRNTSKDIECSFARRKPDSDKRAPQYSGDAPPHVKRGPECMQGGQGKKTNTNKKNTKPHNNQPQQTQNTKATLQPPPSSKGGGRGAKLVREDKTARPQCKLSAEAQQQATNQGAKPATPTPNQPHQTHQTTNSTPKAHSKPVHCAESGALARATPEVH